MKNRAQPSPDYDGLLRQFHAQQQLIHSVTAERTRIQRTWLSPETRRAYDNALDSEREMNQQLTDEVDELQQELAFLRYFYDVADNAIGPASDDVYEMIKDEFLDREGYLPDGYERNEDEL